MNLGCFSILGYMEVTQISLLFVCNFLQKLIILILCLVWQCEEEQKVCFNIPSALEARWVLMDPRPATDRDDGLLQTFLVLTHSTGSAPSCRLLRSPPKKMAQLTCLRWGASVLHSIHHRATLNLRHEYNLGPRAGANIHSYQGSNYR